MVPSLGLQPYADEELSVAIALPESDYIPEQDVTGVSNEDYAAAVETGGVEGEAQLQAAIHQPSYEPEQSYMPEEDYEAAAYG